MDALEQLQESQRQQQQLQLQRAQLRLNQQQAMAGQEDREFRQVLTALDPRFGLTPEAQADILNKSSIPKKFGFPGAITPDALAPFHNVVLDMKAIVEGKKKGNLSDYQPVLENFLANPNYFHMADQPVLTEAAGQYKNEKIDKLVAAPTPTQQARQRLNDYGPLLQFANQNDWADSYQTFANRELEAQRKVNPKATGIDLTEATYHQARLEARSPSVLVEQLRKDQATHELDLLQTGERDRVRYFLKNTPGAVEKAMEGKLAELGFTTDPVKNVSLQVFQIMKKDPSERTPQDKKFVDAAVVVLPQHVAEQLGFLTARQEKVLANDELKTVQGRSAVVGQLLTDDGKEAASVSKMAQERQKIAAVVTQQKNPTPDQQAEVTKQAQDYLTMFQGSEAAYRQKAEQSAQYYQTLIQKSDQEQTAIRERMQSAPSTKLADLSARLKDAQREQQANQAGLRLVTDHNPYELEILRSSQDGLRMRLQASTASGQSDEVAKLTTALTDTEATIQQKEQGRRADLATIGGYRNLLLEHTKNLGGRLTSLSYKMDKDANLGAATTMALNLIGQPDPDKPNEKISLTRAMTLAADHTGAEKGALSDTLTKVGNLSLPQAQQDLDAAIVTWQYKHGAYPDHPVLVGLTASVAKNYPLLKREDIQKGIKETPLVTVKLGDETDKVIAKNLEESQAAAEGAVSTVDAANRIEQALATGKVTLGPTATIRNQINQVSQIMGVSGRDTAEQLVNTRGVIRGLAQFALGARKQLKGQGQVSDYEGRLIERAEAGQIDDFTMPELTSFVAVTKQLAIRQHTQHQKQVERFRNTPAGRERAAFFDVEPLPSELSTTSPVKIREVPNDGLTIKRTIKRK